MSDLMRPIAYRQLLNWVIEEYRKKGTIFTVAKILHRDGRRYPIFDGAVGTVFGPAAGPNTQLAQNIIASYAAGASWFELKTVQKMDGRELAACVPKPCIDTRDEGYNCEWSTELEVGQAFEEYVKAWFITHIIAEEFDLGDPDAVVFNMSVGYDLAGVKTPKMQKFLSGMREAKESAIFRECLEASVEAVKNGTLKHVTEKDILAIPSVISDSVTESTLHGCPPEEIERIANYLLEEQHLNTYVKCNPTLLGYETARTRLDALGYDYIAFDDHHFKEDLQWEDAVPMFERLMANASRLGLSFGLKLSNTFPVDVKANELPSQEMYMSGRAEFPLTIELVNRIAAKFDGKLRISYSGGADFHNIHDLAEAGIWPVTMATTVLKPGGYMRFAQIAGILSDLPAEEWKGIDVKKIRDLSARALEDPYYRKPLKPLVSRKMESPLPLMDCFEAPCRSNCPINQDIPAYLRAMEEGDAQKALQIILERNALPFITGTICPHTCADRCMRNHYEEGVHIREVKLQAAEKAFAPLMESISENGPSDAVRGSREKKEKVAIVGGGPAGLAAASFLSRAGADVTVFEKRDTVGGVVRHAIPGFRISQEAIDRDVELCGRYGAKICTGHEVKSLKDLSRDGFSRIIVAVGAWAPGRKALEYGEAMDALDFLTKIKENQDSVKTGENVIVIGGGNTAMDVARAAIRLPGVRKVSLVYRRTRRYMPADEEELAMAVEDGVEFCELLSPVGLKDGKLECRVMQLGEADESGRRSPVATGRTQYLDASLVITAVGERIDTALYRNAGVTLDEKGRPVVDGHMETTTDGIYAIGDGRRGPATVVKAIADAQAVASAITGADFESYAAENQGGQIQHYLDKKGVLSADLSERPDTRCLGCAAVCEVCTDVCPNRANTVIEVKGLEKPQILHIDGMCNECGNCAVFCPHSGRPYRDKLTLYWYREDFDNSENAGFLPLKGTKVLLRFAGKTEEVDVADEGVLYEPLRKFILTVIRDYAFLLR